MISWGPAKPTLEEGEDLLSWADFSICDGKSKHQQGSVFLTNRRVIWEPWLHPGWPRVREPEGNYAGNTGSFSLRKLTVIYIEEVSIRLADVEGVRLIRPLHHGFMLTIQIRDRSGSEIGLVKRRLSLNVKKWATAIRELAELARAA